VFLLVLASASAADLTIDFLDIGQGDGVLLRTPSGYTVLIDGGKPSGHADDQLVALGVDHIDLLIATHADYDHAGIHEAILGEFEVGTYLTNGLPHSTLSYGRITALAERLAAAGRLEVVTSEAFATGEDLGIDDVSLYLLPPPESLGGADQNTHSIGIVLEYLDFKAVFTGDSERAETNAWLTEGLGTELLADIDVYKAIHHGANNGDAGNVGWLDLVFPEHVVIPVGPNSYGHPTVGALATYDSYGALVYRTDEDGRVSIDVATTGGYAITTESGGIVFVSGHPVPPVTVSDCPATHPVKGNVGSALIYHLPAGAYYGRTYPEECFATAGDAVSAGYRASSR
jgi:competence protein ComEC